MLGILRRVFSFTSWTTSHPNEPPPGDMLDASFDAQDQKISEIEALVSDVRRSDGALRNGVVGIDQLHPDLRKALRIPSVSAHSNGDELGWKSAEATADVWAHASRDWAEYMPDTIPDGSVAVMDITGDHWSSRWWANQAALLIANNQSIIVSETAPTAPSQGQLWYNSSNGLLYVFYIDVDSGAWVQVAGSTSVMAVGDTPPALPAPGQQWFESSTGATHLWYDDGDSRQWVQTNGGAGGGSTQGVNVRNFGAIGDGVADDSYAIQSAINYALTLPYGGRVHIPAGRYKIVTPIVVPKNANRQLLISGDGFGSTILCNSVTGASQAFQLNVGGAVGGGIGCTIRDLSFRGSAKVGKALRIDNANGLVLENIRFYDLASAITSTASYAVQVHRCDFGEIAGNAFNESVSCHNLTIDTCMFYHVGFGGTGGVFRQTSNAQCLQMVMHNNDIEYCGYVVSTAGKMSALSFEGNFVEGSDVQLFQATTGLEGLKVESNHFGLNVAQAFVNWTNSVFNFNSLWTQAITFGATCVAVEAAGNSYAAESSLGPLPWKQATPLLNGWTNGLDLPMYRRTPGGLLAMKGSLVSSGSPGCLGSIAFVLPVGYRPAQQAALSLTIGEIAEVGSGRVVIGTNGNVVPNGPVHGIYNLDGILIPLG